jgi:hypothetical protein
MNYKGVLKRLLPFAATFAVAVFITSFFVDLHRPSKFAEFRMRRYEECQRLRFENEELRNENLRLRNEIENNRISVDEIPNAVPAPPMPPMPPALPHMRAPRAQ